MSLLPVIVDACRSPIVQSPARLFDTLQGQELVTGLGQLLLQRNSVQPEKIQDLYLGLTQLKTPNFDPAREIALMLGLSDQTPGHLATRQEASGLEALIHAHQRLSLEDSLILCGSYAFENGDEEDFSSTLPELARQRPEVYCLPGWRMEKVAARLGLTRQNQEEWLLECLKRAQEYQNPQGKIAPVQKKRKVFSPQGPQEAEQGIQADVLRPIPNAAQLSSLQPLFTKNGSITPALVAPLAESATLCLMTDAQHANREGLNVLGRIVSFHIQSISPASSQLASVAATQEALAKADLKSEDIDLYSVVDTHSTVTLGFAQELELDLKQVNSDGGALAHGLSRGSGGAIECIDLLFELRQKELRYGLVCCETSSGHGIAAVIEAFAP